MPVALERKLRSMLTALVIAASIGVAGLAAWATRRYETSRERPRSACGEIVDSVFASGGAAAPDSALVSQLLSHKQQCIGDATYVDQTRRLMLNLQRVDDARTLVSEAEQWKAMSQDELKAQGAWIDLTAAHVAWSSGDESTAATLRNRAIAATSELRRSWPEWQLPYIILTEADRVSWKPAAEPANDYFAIERSERGRKLNGAFVRALVDWQPAVYVFLISLAGALGLFAGMSGWRDRREMASLPTSAVAEAKPGYVELEGTLDAISDDGHVIDASGGARVVWFEIARRNSVKGSRWRYERSAEMFAIRDATGSVVVDPAGMTVYTRHTTSKYNGALGSGHLANERTLIAGDAVYALGQLSVGPAPDGRIVKWLRVADNGRRLLVSNLDEARLLLIAKIWVWAGASVFALSLALLVWSFHQRYGVINAPDVVRLVRR